MTHLEEKAKRKLKSAGAAVFIDFFSDFLDFDYTIKEEIPIREIRASLITQDRAKEKSVEAVIGNIKGIIKSGQLKYTLESIIASNRDTKKRAKHHLEQFNIHIQISQAFIDFDNGKRPENYKPAKSWFVLDKNKKRYPLKNILHLAKLTDLKKGFTSHTGDIYLRKLGYTTKNTASDIDASKARKERIKASDPIPKTYFSKVEIYERNPDVIAEVLYRAKGDCEECKNPAPFLRKKDNTPYLEVHHKRQLAHGGEDTLKNALALCPNCHREQHYG